MTPIISGLTNKFNTRSVKCWSPFDIDSIQILAITGLIESVQTQKGLVLGADLNEHVGEGNIGDEEIMGSHGAGTRNKEVSMVVNFAKRMVWPLSTLISKRKMNTG